MSPTLRYTCALLGATLAWAGPVIDRVRLSFEVNAGQSKSPAPFVARGVGYSLEFTPADPSPRRESTTLRQPAREFSNFFPLSVSEPVG